MKKGWGVRLLLMSIWLLSMGLSAMKPLPAGAAGSMFWLPVPVLNQGEASIAGGVKSTTAGTPDLVLTGSGGELGNSAAKAGDVNGDGYDDAIVGAHLYGAGAAGAFFIYYGGPAGLSATPAIIREGQQAGMELGYAVAGAGDLNRDGYADVLVGAPRYDSGETDEGALFVYYGGAAGIADQPNLILQCNQAGALLGWSAAGVGEVTGDSYVDVIVGAPGYDNGETNEGAVFVYPGTRTGLRTTPSLTWEGDQAESAFGYSLAGAGDTDNDGYPEVMVGARYYDDGQTNEGAVFIYYNSEDGVGEVADSILHGGQDWARMGSSLGAAGDLNGDGYGDVYIGLPGYYASGWSPSSAVFVYYGSNTGLRGTPDVRLVSQRDDLVLGDNGAAAGDVNRDGYADLLLGGAGYDNGQTNEGAAFVYLGGKLGLNVTPVVTMEVNQTEAHFGQAVAGIGDVNRDGNDDILVGAPNYNSSTGNPGAAFIYYGAARSLSISPTAILSGSHPVDQFGSSIANAGDVNGDGYADLVVGARYYDGADDDSGRAWIYSGSAAGVSATPAQSLGCDLPACFLGSSVAGAGDVNGDGYSDVIVGAPGYDNDTFQTAGAAFVYYGSALGVGAMPAVTLTLTQAGALFGESVVGIGDLNGDGYDDVAVGATEYDATYSSQGAVFIYYGSAAGLSVTPTQRLLINREGVRLGSRMAAGGDVNGDGYADLLVGAPAYLVYSGYWGAVLVYLGRASGFSAQPDFYLASDRSGSTKLGWATAAAGDLNGDGYGDVIAGAPNYEKGSVGEGALFVYAGGPTGPVVTPTLIIEGNQPNAHLGSSVAGLGDMNGDGYGDFLVGATQYTWQQATESTVFLYQGRAGGVVVTPTAVLVGLQRDSSWGGSLSGGGDFNGDGYAEWIVGASTYDLGDEDEGAVYIYHGAASASSVVPARTVEGNQTGMHLGQQVAATGDLNGDGYSDAVVGGDLYDNGQVDEGAAQIYYGTAIGLNATPAITLEGNQAGARLGRTATGVGDLNGDGYADLLVGAPYFDRGQTDEGAAFIHYGRPAGIAATGALTLEMDQAGALLGASAAGVGDLNGDGYADLVVGAPQYSHGENSEGGAFLYYGGAAGLNGTPALTLEVDQASAQFGGSVAGAGDVNGDGYADLLVGATAYDGGETDEGAVFLYYGSAAGPVGAPVRLEGNQVNAYLGAGLAGPGDINGDGYADIVVGAGGYDHDEVNEGALWVYHGGAAGLTATPALTLEGNLPEVYLGTAPAGAGDVNGDGYADLLVGGAAYTNSLGLQGAAWLYLGGVGGLRPVPESTLEGSMVGSAFGNSVAGPGDVNGDGYADLLVGARDYAQGQTGEGAFFYFSGARPGRGVKAGQWQSDGSVPVVDGGLSRNSTTFLVRMTVTSPRGRERVKLQVQACPVGVSFGAACREAVSLAWTDLLTAAQGLVLSQPVSGLNSATVYHWRARALYAPATHVGVQPVHGPWRRLEGRAGVSEIRMGAPMPDLVLTKTVTPAADLPGERVTYTLSFSNVGAAVASGVAITDLLPLAVTAPVSAAVLTPPTLTLNSVDGQRYVWQIAALEPGQGGVITIAGVLASPLAGSAVTNSAAVSGGQPEISLLNNGSSAGVAILNGAPGWNPIGARAVDELTPLQFNVGAVDPNLDPVSYTLAYGSRGAIDLSTGNFSWTPTELQGPGVYTAAIRAGDGRLTTTEIISITVNEVNVAPVLNVIGAKSVKQLVTLIFTATATDSDRPVNPLTFSLDTGSVGAIQAATGVFSWTPTEATAPGIYTAAVRVSDGQLAAVEVVSITVNPANTAPVLNSIGAKSVNELAALTFTAAATDQEGGPLTFTLAAGSVGTIGATSGAFSWTPTEAQGPGLFTATVRVSDGRLTGTETFSITVNEVNVAPILNPISAKSVNELTSLVFTATASDADLPGNLLTFTLQSGSMGTIEPASGVYSWTPTEAQGPGVYTAAVRVSDGRLSAVQAFSLTVNEVNVAPVANDDAYTVTEGSRNNLLNVLANDSDADGHSLTVAAVGTGDHGGSVSNQGSGLSYSPAMDFAGVEVFTYTARDNFGGAATARVTVTVTPLPTYTLQVQVVGNGSVAAQPALPFYKQGQVVTLTATPESGYYFERWSGDAAGINPVARVTMSGARQVTATFGVTCYPVAGGDFTFEPALPRSGESVQFAATVLTGTAPFTYSWEFGTGMGAQGEAVSYTYPVSWTFQVYTATLTVVNGCPGSMQVQKVVAVQPHRVFLPVVVRP